MPIRKSTITVTFISFSVLLCACTSIFFQPSNTQYPTAQLSDDLEPQALSITSTEGVQLAAWYIEAKSPRALVVQFHGNAQNITTQYRFLAWMPAEGFDLLTFDYRGYGTSSGAPSLQSILDDVHVVLAFANERAEREHLPLIIVGQSLGGSLVLKALQTDTPSALKMIVIESAFYSYRELVREKLAASWLTWPFQWISAFLISDMYSPGGAALSRLPNVPKILLYSEQDPVVPLENGVRLYNDMQEPKKLWLTNQAGHVNGFFADDERHRKDWLTIAKAMFPNSSPKAK